MISGSTMAMISWTSYGCAVSGFTNLESFQGGMRASDVAFLKVLKGLVNLDIPVKLRVRLIPDLRSKKKKDKGSEELTSVNTIPDLIAMLSPQN